MVVIASFDIGLKNTSIAIEQYDIDYKSHG